MNKIEWDWDPYLTKKEQMLTALDALAEAREEAAYWESVATTYAVYFGSE